MEEFKKEKQLPSSQITVQIGKNTYTIKMPNYGQFIDMERLKYKLTGGTKDQMLFSNSNSSIAAFVYTEAIAALTILIPDLTKDLVATSLLELNPIQSKELIKVYTKQIDPWLKAINEAANEEVDVNESK